MFGRKGKGGDTTAQGFGVHGFGAQGSTRQDYSAATAVASSAHGPVHDNLAQDDPTRVGNRLVVGQGLTFSGDIEACNHLMISGSVVSDVKLCDRLEISTGGSFQGTATVNDADIAGQFEGELIVLGHLRLRESGRIRGRITYGTLSVEAGGRLLGITDSAAEGPRPQPRTVPRAVVVPLRPVAHTAGRDPRP